MIGHLLAKITVYSQVRKRIIFNYARPKGKRNKEINFDYLLSQQINKWVTLSMLTKYLS